MTRFRLVVAAGLLLSPAMSGAWSDNCPNGDFCACPGETQCLSPYASCEDACGAYASGGRPVYDTDMARRKQEAATAQAEERRRQMIIDTNNQGVRYHEQHDWVNAIIYYEAAIAADPDNVVFKENLKKAKESRQYDLDVESARQANLRNAAAASDRMKNVMERLSFDASQGSPVPPSEGGLDFSASIPSTAPAPYGDPMVVDARNVPSGLPASIDRSIKSAYPEASPAVVDRLRKGFQAVEVRDWKAARAWFQDALQRDPKNPGLQRFVALATDPVDRQQTTSAAKRPLSPSDTEIAAFFTFFRDPLKHRTYQPTEEVRTHVLSLSNDEFKRLLACQLPLDTVLQLPTEEDMILLFPGDDSASVKP